MWLALRFIHWALDSRADVKDDLPALVVEQTQQRQRVISASRYALDAGIRYNMGLADARIRLENVHVHERNSAAEQAAMARLAGWAWHYSNQVHWSIACPGVDCARLVLEIGASLRLFDGVSALFSSVRKDLALFGYRYQAGIGQSPQAALAFARTRTCPGPGKAFQADIGTLRIGCLALNDDIHATLVASGIRRTGELLALPSGMLVRRFGPELLHELERLQGQRPHGLSLYQLPTRYDTRHELLGSVENTQGLVFVLRRVFDELAVFLRGADSAIQTLRLDLFHEREPATRIVLRLSAPSHDAHHLERVARERLGRITLTAPVLALGLTSDRLRRSTHQQTELWQTTGSTGVDPWPGVLDRLRARLGRGAVSWIVARADHRPEHASALQDRPPPRVFEDLDNTPAMPRPLWLLDVPEPITSCVADRLTWISGPERIESGWWHDGRRRDYYRALDKNGALIWVFQDLDAVRRGQRHYYLHGLFG